MSLKKDHRAKNDWPCHRRIKRWAKKEASRNLRTRLKRQTNEDKT